jgi:pilus assembly protein CpaB
MRDIRPWIFLGLGLFLAGLTGLALYGIASETASRRAAAPADMVGVVVAKVDIKPRTVIAADMLASREYPKDLVPQGAVLNPSDVVGQTTIAAVPSGAAVLKQQLASKTNSGTSATLDWGKVLVAFPTADPLTAAGLIQIGDHVDILATMNVGAGEAARKTQLTVQDLVVVDVLSPTKDNVTGKEVRATSLVFEVDHQVALVLKYLRDAEATIDIVVRSEKEKDPATAVSVDLGYVTQTYGFRR